MKFKKKFCMMTITFALLLCLLGCSNKDGNQEVPEYVTPGFMERIAFHDYGDGWILKMDIYQNDKNDEEISHVTLTGYNLKFKTMDEYYLKVVDKDKNILNTINRTLPYLGDNEAYDIELKQIHDYLTDKKFQTPISLEDLDGLEILIFDKNLIVELYNEALDKEKPDVMKYANLPIANCKQERLTNNDIIQVAYLSDYRGIGYVNFEYIYANGIYLSDLVKDDLANDEQIHLYQLLKDTGEKIIKENDWNVELSSDFEKNKNDLKKTLSVLLEATFTKESK